MLETVNKQNFNELLGRFSTSELENLVEKFPYFQHGHLLLAKKYQQQNNPRFDQQLQLAALYTQDRELLYAIFNEKEVAATLPQLPVIEKVEDKAAEPEQLFVEEIKAPVIEHVVEQPVNADLSGTENTEVREVEPVLEIETSAEQAEVISIPVTEPVNVTAQQQEVETEPLIETEAQNEVLIVAFEEQEPVTVAEQPPMEQQAAVVLEHVEQFSAADPHTFDEWLKAYSSAETPKIVELKQEILPVEPEKQDEELEKLYLTNIPVNLQELVEEETNYSKGLDKFIEEQIQKHKGVTVKPTANENELDPELVTETMAKVYEMQKKYNKAIKCYETLGLKYPEKFDFFAARINYLKNIT